MNISFIEPTQDYLGMAPSDYEGMLLLIERCGRTAYQSQDKMTVDSSSSFLEMMKNRKHMSVLEHSNICICFQNTAPELIGEIHASFNNRMPFFAVYMEPTRVYVAGSIRSWLELLTSPSLPIIYEQVLRYYYPGIFGTPTSLGEDEESLELLARLVPSEEQRLLDATYGTALGVYLFRIVTSRGITHEIVRARSLQFTQESTRYVNSSVKGFQFVLPYWYGIDAVKDTLFKQACGRAAESYQTLIDLGSRAQEARDVLPHALKAEIIVSGRMPSWDHFLKLRLSVASHPDIRKQALWIADALETQQAI